MADLARRVRALKHMATRVAFERAARSTASEVRLDEVGLDQPEQMLYAPSSWLFLPRALRSLDVDSDDVFVDFGSGKGRVVLQAARHPFGRIIGVEVSDEFNAVARENIRRVQGRLKCRGVELVTADVLGYAIPDDMTYAYFYYPFAGSIFRSVIERISASLERRPRRMTIIFAVPEVVDGPSTTGPEIGAFIRDTGQFELSRRYRHALARRRQSIAIYTSRCPSELGSARCADSGGEGGFQA